ncbi:receptor-like protein kinase FERONIA [Malania oleifera]|uniref:receptor-like protein kinase FERONIA n=1 Tax=Malania oleifera TaxID=397392 RepID=UPI0025ADCD9D|nr:receptor-like protein kinase FERONIA [Malania oleifera]
MKENTEPTALTPLSTLCPFYFSFFLLIRLSIGTTAAAATTSTNGSNYIPTDKILLDCGSSRNSTARDGREWAGDSAAFKSGPVEQDSNNSTSQSLRAPFQGTAVDPVPYMTARISRAQFTYSFPVSPGQKFIRLHFYPTSYPGFDASYPFFSVKAGPFTLLNNFSATPFPSDDSTDPQTFFREFCVDVAENQEALNVTFAPVVVNTTPRSDVFAFVNGIEILSMPTNLYYTPAGDGEGPHSIGQIKKFTIQNNTALETVYRFNVGGKGISPKDDSGLFRTWSGGDYDFILTRTFVPNADPSVKINYTKVPQYTAPPEVYETARTLGPYEGNEKFNLTWKLPVDSGFMYLVRLHFCEFQPEIATIGDRPFIIYIDNQTADSAADVIKWSGGNSIPVYRDYVLMTREERNGDKHFVFIALNPNVELGGYTDVILNGLEMFKLNDSIGNLGGSKARLPATMTPNKPPQPGPKTSKTNKALVVVIVGSVMGGFALLFLLYCAIFSRWRTGRGHSLHGRTLCWWWPPYKSDSIGEKSSSIPDKLCRHFSLSDIYAATNNFETVIGKGGFGTVYKGCIDGDKEVAVKRSFQQRSHGAAAFANEIRMLSQIHHLNLVSLIGYCNEGKEMILVYEYMVNGTLSEHLYETDNDPLMWRRRLEICIDAARGLNYLHRGTAQTIIHRDVKTTNILLDKDWVAKVSDFGLSKMGGPYSMPDASISTGLKGTPGYLDPDYAHRRRLTEKADVYSFGVVLFQVLCARKAVNDELGRDQAVLAYWAKKKILEGTLGENIDPYLMGKIAPECFRKFVDIARSCVRDRGDNRPSMLDVVGNLEHAFELQVSAEASNQDFPDFHQLDLFPHSGSLDEGTLDSGDSGFSRTTATATGTTSSAGFSSLPSNSDFDCTTSSNDRKK